MIKAVIVDDEPYCVDVLKILLQKYCPTVEVAASFNSPEEALQFLYHSPPSLVFLDIEMPGMSGFELLRRLKNIDFSVIFTTAYDHYAIKAFKFNAIDYLLKPIDKDELINAVYKSLKLNKADLQKLEFTQYLKENHIPERILLPIGNELILVDVSNIVYCLADGSYTYIHCSDQEKPFLLSKNLREIEELLSNPHFFRPHNSWLINNKFIHKIIKSDAMEIVVQGNVRIPVARSKRQEVIEWLQKLT